jgi:hypothetical protein
VVLGKERRERPFLLFRSCGTVHGAQELMRLRGGLFLMAFKACGQLSGQAGLGELSGQAGLGGPGLPSRTRNHWTHHWTLAHPQQALMYSTEDRMWDHVYGWDFIFTLYISINSNQNLKGPELVAHTYNPIYSGDRVQEDHS